MQAGRKAMKNRRFKGMCGVCSTHPLIRRLSILLSITILTTTIFSISPFTTETVYADDDKTISGLCTGAIANPTPSGGGWSYVYYGKYNGNAMKFRVLDKAATEFGGNTMLLDCDSKIKDMEHCSNYNMVDYEGYSWAESDINIWLNGDDFLGDATDPAGAFTLQEMTAIAGSTKATAADGDGNGWDSLGYAPLSGDRIFLLDAVEATRPSYGYATTHNGDKNRQKIGNFWWLRSPFTISGKVITAGYVDHLGWIHNQEVYYENGVSPAFNLDLDSIIFASEISSENKEYKLTVKDPDMTIEKTDGSDIRRSRNVVTVPYTITGGSPTQVSVLITDSEYSAGTVITDGYSYQKLNVSTLSSSGIGKFTIPDEYADKICGTNYYAYILAEDVNGTYETDYASVPYSITIPDTPLSQVAAPTFSPVGGTYTTTKSVAISCGTAGATIHYTMDGSDPTDESPVYFEPIKISDTTIIKAVAIKPGMNDSEVVSVEYTIDRPRVATPIFSPTGGTYTRTQSVTISCGTEGATIHYTTNGSDPTDESPVYSEPLKITETKTIKAIAVMEEWLNSDIAEAEYTIDRLKVATPIFSPTGGTYTRTQSVTISCGTEGATIHYTTNGSDPTKESPVYSEPVEIHPIATIKAIAVKDEWINSDVAEAQYTTTSIRLGGDVLAPVMTNTNETEDLDEKNRITTARTVYYGSSGSQKWFVIGHDGSGAVRESGTITLFAPDNLIKDQNYANVGGNNSYVNSNIKTVVDGYYSSLFTSGEQSVISSRTLAHGDYCDDSTNLCDGISDTSNPSVNIWLLSTKEADLIGQGYRKANDLWYLRSPGKKDRCAAFVAGDGTVALNSNIIEVYFDEGVRPAFNLDLSSIILTSAAEGGKIPGSTIGTLNSIASNLVDEWKLTVLDSSRNGFSASAGTDATLSMPEGYTSWIVPVTYSDAKTGSDKEHVSAILTDSNGAALYYGYIATNSAQGTQSVTIPNGLHEGTYTLNVLSETVNGDKKTDYSSPISTITLTVTESNQVKTPTFSPVEGTYTEAQSVTISCPTSGAEIYYTTDGTNPTSGKKKYEGAISVTTTTTIKAIAVKAGMTDSDVAAATYTIQTQDPTPPDPPHEHSYASAVTAKPTCTQKGVRTYKCECGDSYTEEIKALGHEYKSEITKEPSVTEQGVRKFTCLRCGDSYVETIEKLDGAFLLYEKEGGTDKICASKKLNSGRSFTLIPIFESGKVVNARVVWSSSNPDIATVTQGGKVTALGSGETRITVQSEENAALKAYCYVYVAEPVTEVSLDKKNYSFGTGESVKLNATVLPFTAKQELKWTVDNENVSIAVSKDTMSATVTGKTAGKTKVTAIATDGSGKKATCSFTIGTAVPDFTIAGKNNVSAVEAGKTLNMIVNWGTSKPSNSGVTWELTGSNANYIASITDKGVFTGITAGKVTVNAISKANPDKKASAEITVSKPAENKKAKVTGITFANKDKLVSKGLNAGKSYTINTKLTLDGKGSADSHAVAWVTSDPTVATVNQRGTVKAVAPGTVTVTAITRDAADINTAPKATVEFRVYSMIKGVKLDKKKLTIGTQAGTQYGKVSIASVSPANASDPSIAWAVNSNGVALAAIPEDGYPADGEFASAGTGITTKSGEAVAVRASTPGVVKLTGITKDGSKKKVTCTITVRGEVTGLTLKTQTAKNGINDVTQGTVSGNKVTYKSTMKESGSLKLTPVFEINGVANTQSTKKTYNAYRKYTDLSVSYRSSDTTVATVDKNGKIKIQKKVASGKTATIYGVTADGQQSVEVFVTVK